MSRLVLRLELVSDALPGSGEGRASSIDRDVTHDSYGLPRLSGRAMKGLLREAYLEVVESFAAANIGGGPGAGLATVGELFGEQGAAASGRLSVPDLAPPEAAAIRLHLAQAFRQGVALDPETVLRTFTILRRQTAIDTDTGAARENTLRTSRVLRRGLALEAELTVAPNPGDPGDARARRSLALACLALRRLGTGRNRGLGRCAVTLLADAVVETDGGAHGVDLVEDVRGWLGGIS